jgi:copper transport protein
VRRGSPTAGRWGTRRVSTGRVLLALALMGAGALASAPAAWAHAQLLGTSPASGATVQIQPRQVIVKFNQAVGGALGAVRVYDARGAEVDDLSVTHPSGQQHWLGVGLKAHLSAGTYTATYRVISADTHIVYGGVVFNIGHAGVAPKYTVAGLIGRNRSGRATAISFGVVRGLNYLSLAVFLGGIGFLAFVWLPGLTSAAGTEGRWSLASRAFARRMRKLLMVATVLGAAASALGVPLQGATAAGVSAWAALKGSAIPNTLESRFGEVWGLRAADWCLLGVLLLTAQALGRPVVSEMTHTAVDANRPALTRPPPRWIVALLAVGAGYLAVTPALAGHASIESPVAVFFPSDVLHVLGASVWVGGIACLLLGLPAATRELEVGERSRLLYATLARFSPLALAAVLVIAATGITQAYIDVRSFSGLLNSTYGVLVIVKVALLLALIGLGWTNRERVIPALRHLVGEARSPGGPGVLVRRTMRGELALMLSVFGVTAALITYAPPIDAASGPFATTTTLGPAQLEMTVEPARVGPNTIHLCLIDAKSGTQFTATKELSVAAYLRSKGIGPLPLKANLAGPGHYTLNSAELTPAGTWEIELTDRVSEFTDYSKTVKVPIR